MKLFTLALVLISTTVFAESFSCYSTIDMEKTKKLITVNADTIEIEGLEAQPILEVVSAKIDGKRTKKCANLSPDRQYKCLNKLVPDAKEGDSKLSMHNVLIQMSELEPDPKGSIGTVSSLDVATKTDINLKNVASGTVYVLKFGTYYPNSGLYEFFDGRGNSLGKFFLEAFARNCR